MGVCFVGTPSYCCYGYAKFSKTGTYEWSSPIPSMWQFDKMNWANKITEVPFIMRDRAQIKVDKGEPFFDAPSTKLYFPMKTRLTITIVSKGGTLMKPEPAASDAGVADSAADTAVLDGKTSDDAIASSDVASADTAVANPDASGTDTATTAADASTDPSADGATAQDDQTAAASGCATSGTSSGSSRASLSALALVAIGIVLRGRARGFARGRARRRSSDLRASEACVVSSQTMPKRSSIQSP